MRVSFERFALLAGLLVLVSSLQFGFGLGGAAIALPGALLLGAGTTFLWLHFNLGTEKPWLPPLLVSVAVLLSSVILELAFRPDLGQWFAFLIAGASSAAVMTIVLRNRRRCNLCSRSLSSQALTFRCPRCTQEVCEETCWNFEHRRCNLCLEQRVPIMPIETAWWTRVAGPRVTQGRCLVCLAAADKVDLRSCPNCRRMQCRDCWDFENGQCSRCAAALPDLPPALNSIIGSGYGGALEENPR